MQVLARTRIVAWEGGSLWIVDAAPNLSATPRRTDVHAHHAIQVTVSAGGAFRLATADLASAENAPAVAVAADVGHVFEAEGLVAILFIEPESRLGRAASQRLFGDAPLAMVMSDRLGDFGDRVAGQLGAAERDDEALVRLGRDLVGRLAGDTASETPDWRVRKMIAWAARQLDGRISLSDVGHVGGLSAGRLGHLFAEQTGLPFRTYVLWLRLTKAVSRMAEGAPATQAAHEAGFADSAHFSRTFRRMFGVAPTNLRMT